MADIVTVNPDQLGEAAAPTDEMAAVVFAPGGPLQKLAFEKLLAKLISTNLCKANKAALDADLAHDEDAVALVFNDATALLNGWYRKTGASGAGAWTQFEVLARAARDAALSAVSDAAAQAALSNRYANANDDSDIAGGAPGERGALWWLNQVKAVIAANLGRVFQWRGSATRVPFWVGLDLEVYMGADAAPSDGVSYFWGRFVDWLRSLTFTTAQLTTFAGLYRLYTWRGSSTRQPLIIGPGRELYLGLNAAPDDGLAITEGLFIDNIIQRASAAGSTGIAAVQQIALAPADRPTFEPSTTLFGLGVGGQSLGAGRQGQPPISLAQPYANLMLTGGVKGTGTGLVPLVEDTNREGGVASTDTGETLCSGAANSCCTQYAQQEGADPNSLVIVPFNFAQGGTGIVGISKGSAAYNRGMQQVANIVAALPAGKKLVVPAVVPVHGETDGDAGMDRATYFGLANQWFADLSADIMNLTGQTSPVHILMCQCPKNIRTNPGIALAQYDLVRQNRLVHFVTQYGFLPYGPDGLHSINVGYKWLGSAYVARAYKQLLVNGRVPDCVWPISATISAGGTTLKVRFRTPTKLVLNGPTIADYGFKVIDNIGVLALSNIRVVNGVEVWMTLSRPVTAAANPMFYNGCHAQAAALPSNGASSDLTDSTSEVITILGQTYSTAHRALSFDLPIRVVEA